MAVTSVAAEIGARPRRRASLPRSPRRVAPRGVRCGAGLRRPSSGRPCPRLARPAGRLWGLVLALAAWTGCASPDLPDPAFQVERTLVQVVAELEAAETVDVYRQDPPRDVSGENLYRASVERLRRMEALGVDPVAQPALDYAMATSLWRLGRYEEAAARWDDAARSPSLADAAGHRAADARVMAGWTAPIEDRGSGRELLARLEERRRGLLDRLEELDGGDPRRSQVEVEIERYDVRAREWYWKYRAAIGAENALSFARHVATTHVDSRRVLEHLLRVGDMYAELARTTVAQADPADHTHDPALLRGLVREALAVYAEVAAVDGRPEREEARAAMVQLEALLARVEEG